MARTLVGAGFLHPERPDRLLRALGTLKDWGPTIAAGYQAAAQRRPDAVALVDERGTLTFREVDERTNRLARALREQGVGPGDGVAILARNHRWFVDISVAVAKLGGRALYLNTMFAAPQIADVCEREQPVAIVHDEEFAEFVAGAAEGRKRFVAWYDDPAVPDAGAPTLDLLAANMSSAALDPPPEPSRVIILTSGTTGTPKGAQRKQPDSLMPIASLLSRDPAARARDHDDRRADVPLVGDGALPPVADARLDARRAAAVRPGGHARRGRPPPGDGARGRAGDAPADDGPAGRGGRALRHLGAARHRGQRQRAPRGARHERDGPLRRRRLQPLRLDRGRLGDDRRAGGPARRAGLRRPPAARDRRAPLRRAGRAR